MDLINSRIDILDSYASPLPTATTAHLFLHPSRHSQQQGPLTRRDAATVSGIVLVRRQQRVSIPSERLFSRGPDKQHWGGTDVVIRRSTAGLHWSDGPLSEDQLRSGAFRLFVASSFEEEAAAAITEAGRLLRRPTNGDGNQNITDEN